MADSDVTRIAGNIGAMNALYSLNNINKQLSIHTTRLATGKRLNSAADDPAGLSISTKMLSRSEGLKVALDNIGDAKNLLAVAESGLGRLNDILIQMRNKAEAAASDTMGDTERGIIRTQLLSYAAQINDIVEQTKWNGNTLIDGTYAQGAKTLTFQTGADEGETTSLTGLADLHAAELFLVDETTVSAVSGTFSGTFVATTSSGVTTATASSATGTAVFTNTGSGMTELSTGDYSVKVNVLSSVAATVQLFDSAGNVVWFDDDGADGGSLVSSRTVTITSGSATTGILFGNGLSIDLVATPAVGSHVSQAIHYSKVGTANLDTLVDSTTFAAYMTKVGTAIDTVNGQLSKIGAMTGSFTFKEDQISAAQINVQASYNRIMNADMAEEQVNASKLQILQQTSTAMLAQANAAPQFLLSLFQ